MIRLFVTALALALTACAGQVDGGPKRFAMGMSGAGDIAVPVRSLQETRFSGVIAQQYDFSCGSAALATLLRYHYDYDVDEKTTFRGMWAHGDRDQIRALGFSLLDMKSWLASRGLAADGYQVDLDQIAASGVPGISMTTCGSISHGATFKFRAATSTISGEGSFNHSGGVSDFGPAWK